MKFLRISVVTMLALVLATGTALAQDGRENNGNPCPGQKAYQLNIIGSSDKNPDMTGNNGHRIFVKLNGQSKIFMTGDTDTLDGTKNGDLDCGDKFEVLDANGTDGEATLLVPCDNVNSSSTEVGVCFDVYATPLGTPGGKAEVDVVCRFDGTVAEADIDEGSCEDVPLGSFDFELERKNGTPIQQNITNFLRASGCFDTDMSGTCDPGEKTFNNVWIFNLEALLEYFWEYDNNGLRLSQVRFCESEDCGFFGTVPE